MQNNATEKLKALFITKQFAKMSYDRYKKMTLTDLQAPGMGKVHA